MTAMRSFVLLSSLPAFTAAGMCKFKTGADLMVELRSVWGCDASAAMPTSCPCVGNGQHEITCPADMHWTPGADAKCVNAVVDREAGWVTGDAIYDAEYGASCDSVNHEVGSLECTRTHAQQMKFGEPAGSCPEFGDGYNEAMDSADWCVGQKFCFVDPCNCNKPDVALSNYFPMGAHSEAAAYYSAETCGGVNLWKVDQCAAFMAEGTCQSDGACMWDASATMPTPAPAPSPDCAFKKGADLMTALRSTWGCDASAPMPTSCPCIGNGQKTFTCPADMKWTPGANDMCVNAVVDREAGWVTGDAIYNAEYGASCDSVNHEVGSLECTRTHADQSMFGEPANTCAQIAGDGYNEAMNSASWCVGQKFCFVDPCNCNKPDVALSNYFPAAANAGASAYYSAETCGGVNLWKTDQCAVFTTQGTCVADGACMWGGATAAEPDVSSGQSLMGSAALSCSLAVAHLV